MVGPGGRPQLGRPINSGGVIPNAPVQAPSPARASPVRSVSMDQKPAVVPPKPSPQPKLSPQQNPAAVEEFQKWCRSQLKSLSGVNCIWLYLYSAKYR